MTLSLTQKERTLLEDQKSHEEICIQKYSSYANQAQDSQLKQMFNSYSAQEQEHLNTINQILGGQVPNMSGQQGQQNSTTANQSQGQTVAQSSMGSNNDSVLCTDMLMTEKYVSGAYNTAIFEFTDANVRQTLNHIQKEEQQHGEGIFNYMQSNGMYKTQ